MTFSWVAMSTLRENPMNSIRCVVLALACVLSACAPPSSGSDQADSTDAGMVVDAGATPVADTGQELVDAGPIEPQNKCLNESDAAALDGTFGDNNETASELAKSCGLACFQQQGISVTNECVVDCMRPAMDGAVSDECLSCFGVSVICTTRNCALVCAADPSSERCVSCQCGGNSNGVNCYEAYTACSGRPSTIECP